jgi:hypothetical protein
LVEAPERLKTFFAESIYDLEGLDLALGYLSAGVVDEALDRMNMWHKEFAPFGYIGWAERYFAEVQRKNQFTLPNILTAEEQSYLTAWRNSIRSLIDRSSSSIATPNPNAP